MAMEMTIEAISGHEFHSVSFGFTRFHSVSKSRRMDMDRSCLMRFDPWVLRSTKSIRHIRRSRSETRCGGKFAIHFFLYQVIQQRSSTNVYHWMSLIWSILQASEHAARGRSHQRDGRGRKGPWGSQEPESLGAHEVATGLVKVCADHVSMVTKPGRPKFTCRPKNDRRDGNHK